ncbi:MAG: hypothetical protein GX117_08120 [Candidatus Hydrogenedentes bacterium]|jgi:hypothetical protein|nr:hypothetical protein [Candidatus Hydrogenedentota bacterium]
MEKKRIYIVAKTYPTISKKYAELVCTAGILEDGSWIRLYPIPFNTLAEEQKYPKYTWINVKITRNTADNRFESYRPDLSTIDVEEKSKKTNWDVRRRIIFKNKKIYTNFDELLSKKNKDGTSLAVFKPTKIKNFITASTTNEWDSDKLEHLEMESKQLDLFLTPEEIKKQFRVVPKVPYKFYYQFEDETGKLHKLMILDWEIGMLYIKCLNIAKGDKETAILKVKEKYYDTFIKNDLHFFLGTSRAHHARAPNPFMIIGVFYPPLTTPDPQMNLFDME